MVTDGIEPFKSALEIFGDESPIKPLAEEFGRSATDALARKGERWFWNRVGSLWSSARDRVSQSGRSPKEPRVNAAVEITRHGAAEERRDLRQAYEILAARSMTDDEWDHDYEEYVQTLSKLQSGDIEMLRDIHEKAKHDGESTSTGSFIFLPLPDLIKHVDSATSIVMDIVDRLEANGLLIVRTESGERQPGNWCVTGNIGIGLQYFSVLPKPRGIVLLEHIDDLEQLDKTAEA